MTKNELQKQALLLSKDNSRLALQWCTGCGKSLAALNIAWELFTSNSNTNILLVVAEIAHKDNWVIEIKTWSMYPLVEENIIVTDTYASLKKHRGKEYDLIIFDEAHHVGSDLRLDILNDIKAKSIIVLSATLSCDILSELTSIYGDFYNHKVSLEKAIEWGILPKPKVYIVPLKLDNTYPIYTIIEEWGESLKSKTIKCKYIDRWTYLKDKKNIPNTKLEMSCTQQQKYDYLSEKFLYWKRHYLRSRAEFAKNKWLQIGSERKRFLGECKTESVKILLQKVKDKRFICFCSSIEQSELLGSKTSIHSKKKESLDLIKSFNNKNINSLFAVGMLQEGQNLADIEIGIIAQLDGQERAFIQKFGRTLRAIDPVQFIFYYEDTRDAEYMESVLEGINSDYINIVDGIKGLLDLKI